MKKRPDELAITALLYDVLNFSIGGLGAVLTIFRKSKSKKIKIKIGL